jgi:hypothetical protein
MAKFLAEPAVLDRVMQIRALAGRRTVRVHGIRIGWLARHYMTTLGVQDADHAGGPISFAPRSLMVSTVIP